MVSVIGLPSSTVEELCAKVRELTNEDIQVANFLCDGNYAVSGSKAACDKLCEIAKPDFKARMTVPLSVAGAFHTNFMAPAVPEVSLTQSSLALPCLALPCPALPCPALPCPALPCPALPYLALMKTRNIYEPLLNLTLFSIFLARSPIPCLIH